MSQIVGIKFKQSGKLYYFAPNGLEFAEGDGVIVETARGIEYGTVVTPNKEVPDEEIKGELKPVLRKATQEDTNKYLNNLSKRKDAIRTAQEMANKRKLDMKFVDAEFTFDNTKLLLYFASDTRIDFRELVRELGSHFHMRIDLRQIGIRDECKMKGGLGPCGRVCCCNDYMNDFGRVSIKMAKRQGLFLNPSKISGLCGRLMCCLKFEDDYYTDTLKFMPKIGSDVDTPKGRGKVEATDLLRQTVVVRVAGKDDSYEMNEYTLEQLGITPVYSACAGCGKCENQDAPDDDDTDELPPDEE